MIKERLVYCARDACLDEIKEQVSQILLVEDGLLVEERFELQPCQGWWSRKAKPGSPGHTASQARLKGLSSLSITSIVNFTLLL